MQHLLQPPTSLQAQQQQQQAGALAEFGAPLQPDLAAAREIEALKDAFAGGPGHPRYRFAALLLNVVDNPASRVKMPGWSCTAASCWSQMWGSTELHWNWPSGNPSQQKCSARLMLQPSMHLHPEDMTSAASRPFGSWQNHFQLCGLHAVQAWMTWRGGRRSSGRAAPRTPTACGRC